MRGQVNTLDNLMIINHFYLCQECRPDPIYAQVTGRILKRALGFVQEWRELHIEELLADWRLAEQNKALSKIAPLE